MDAGDLVENRYELEHPLGSGGMAEVWLANDTRLNRQVAIKFLASRFFDDPENLVRFFFEAQAIARIQHRNVVSVLDFGETDGTPYLVMEYVPGGSVADLAGQPILPERALEIVGQAARAAGAAHERGIVHRDIKPANILLTESGEAKLADFGIASSPGRDRLTATGAAIGSPHYISPEQATGTEARAESDVYSLGIVLYELLTGRTPFHAANPTALAIAHVEEVPAPPSSLAPDLDDVIDRLVLRCLEKDPDDRFSSADALADAIAGDIDIDLEPEGEEPRRGLRVVVLGAITALLCAGVVGASWLGSESETPPPANAAEIEREKSPTPRASASPSAVLPAAVAVPSPSPSPTPGHKKERTVAQERSQDEEEEVEPEPEPSPSPTPEPSPSPSPDPSPEDGDLSTAEPTGTP